MLISSPISSFMWNSPGCSSGCLAFLSLPSCGMDQPWRPVSMTSNTTVALTCMCLPYYCSIVLGFLRPFFTFCFLIFFRIPWSITFPHSKRGQEFGIALLQVPFWIKMDIFFPRFDKRRPVPEGLYHALSCCPGRCVLVVNFFSLTITNWLGWHIH